MILSAIEKKAWEQGIEQGIEQGSDERAKKIYENLLELGVSREIADQAIYGDKLSENNLCND